MRVRPPRSALTPSGEPAESRVARVLEDAGWTILARRMRIGRLELDLVARRADVVAIVEVRGRREGAWVSAFDSLTRPKRARLIAAAKILWRSELVRDESVRTIRIDVASVTYGVGEPRIEIAEGAITIA